MAILLGRLGGAMPDLGSRIRFGTFELDGASSELRKNGIKVHIEDQPFRVLWVLASRHGEVVTREELQEQLWAGDTHVDFDRSLTRAVNKVRLALGDSATNPRFVETLPKRGYRFIVPATYIDARGETPLPVAAPDLPVALPVPGSQHRTPWIWVAATILLTTATAAWFAWQRKPPARIQSVAVLPLVSVSGNSDGNDFSDGMTDQLIAVLSRMRSLRVVPVKSAMHYKGTQKKAAEIARELDVDGIVDGSVAHFGERVRINARLVQFPAEQTVWAESFERNATEVIALQNELARSIAGKIGASIVPEDDRRLAVSAAPVDPHLHSLFLRGRIFASEIAADSLRRGIGMMDEVLSVDPTHSGAHAASAEAWLNLAGFFENPAVAMPKSKAAARKAIELDPRSDHARAVLGRVHLFYDWDWQAAEEQLQAAIALNPNSSESYRSLACLRMAEGRPQESIQAARRAVELDPKSTRVLVNTTMLFIFAREYDAAIAQARKNLEWAPGLALLRSMLGLAYVEKGQVAQGIVELETAVQKLKIPTTLGFLATGYARAGRKAEAEAILRELVALSKKRYVCPFEIAMGFAALRRLDDAFRWMTEGVAGRADCMIYLRSEPWLQPLREDARYAELTRNIGFLQN